MSKRLAEMESEQAKDLGLPEPAAAAAQQPDTSAKPDAAGQQAAADRAAAGGEKTTETNQDPAKGSDTPSAAKAAAPGGEPTKGGDGQDKGHQQQPQAKPGEQPGEQGSKYKQDLERRDKSWKALNAEKSAFEADRTKFQTDQAQARQQLEADRAALKAEQDKHNEQQTPEYYDKYSVKEGQRAQELEGAAKKAEESGDFDRAEKLEDAAKVAKQFANLAKQKADDLRKNPPPDAKKRSEQHQAHVKEWTLKAATDFPEFGKKDSAVQKEAASFLNQVAKNWPEAARLPGIVYFAAERAALKLAADRVSGLEKENGELKKKVTELEGLTNPGAANSAQRLPAAKKFEELSSEDQFASLKAEASTF